MRTYEEEGKRGAKTVNKILDRYSKMLSTILIGNNIVNISASALTTTFVISVFGNVFIGIGTGILTIVVLLVGEIIPKTWASLNADNIALSYAPIILFLMKVLTPIIFLVDLLAKGILRLLHIDPDKRNDTITENELKTYVDVSHEDGQIETEEREMIYNVFEFSDTCAKDIMIPRPNMVTIGVDATREELLSVFKETLYTRIPVVDDEKDTMLGFVNFKDFFLFDADHPIAFCLEDLIREAYYTHEYKKTDDLLLEMRQKSMNVAFVLNEYGSTVGMISMEDLLEELVGEIRDEYDEDEATLIQEVSENTYLIEASMSLSDINDAIHTHLDSETCDSIGGLIISRLDRLPEDEESVTLDDGAVLTVKGLDQNRIEKVLLTLPPKAEEVESE